MVQDRETPELRRKAVAGNQGWSAWGSVLTVVGYLVAALAVIAVIAGGSMLYDWMTEKPGYTPSCLGGLKMGERTSYTLPDGMRVTQTCQITQYSSTRD